MTTDHWVGRAPNDVEAPRRAGALRAHCDQADPVVHARGPQTSSTVGGVVTRAVLGRLEVTRSWRAVLDALMADPLVL